MSHLLKCVFLYEGVVSEAQNVKPKVGNTTEYERSSSFFFFICDLSGVKLRALSGRMFHPSTAAYVCSKYWLTSLGPFNTL